MATRKPVINHQFGIFIKMWFAVFLSFLLLGLQSEIIAYNLVVSGWKSLPVWLDGAFKQPEAEGKPWEPGLRRCSEENPSSLPAVHISAGFRKCLSSNLPSSTSLSQSRDFEQKKWPQPLLLSWPLLLLPLPSPRFLPVRL